MLAGAAHSGPHSGRTWLRWSTVLLPAVQCGCCRSVRTPCRGRRCPPCPGRAGSRCPAGRVRCPRGRTAGVRQAASGQPVSAGRVDLALDQRRRATATCAALPWCRTGGCWSAAVLPQPAGKPDTVAGVWVAAELDAADAVAVRRVGVRTAGVRPGPCRSLRVSAATGTGRLAGGCWRGAATAGRRGRAGGRAGR
jgi:hypothetical protein